MVRGLEGPGGEPAAAMVNTVGFCELVIGVVVASVVKGEDVV